MSAAKWRRAMNNPTGSAAMLRAVPTPAAPIETMGREAHA